MSFLDFLLNKNRLVKWVDGHKTQLAGALASIGGIATAATPLFPPATAIIVAQAGVSIIKAATWVGTYGLLGKAVKTK